MDAIMITAVIGLGALAALGIWIWTERARLDIRRHLAEEAWSHLMFCSKERADLIPSLYDAVVDLMPLEEQRLDGLVELRRKLMRLQEIERQAIINIANALTGTLNNILASARQNPLVSSKHNFCALDQTFEFHSNNINAARQVYNHLASRYNQLVHAFSADFIARHSGHEPLPYFDDAPTVLMPVKPAALTQER